MSRKSEIVEMLMNLCGFLLCNLHILVAGLELSEHLTHKKMSHNVISSFLACTSEEEARQLTESCNNPFVISALADSNGSFIQVSKNVTNVFGCTENELKENHETVFSMTHDDEKGEMFRAYSSALLEGSVYRLMQHINCRKAGPTPVVTHLKKIVSNKNKDMILCLNIRA
jgi:hypothetical protein